MAVADRMTGAAQYIGFIHSGGTVNLSGDSRTFDVTREQEVADASAGSDGARSSKATLKNYSATLEALYIGTAGTASFGSVDIGKEGTLLWGPQGTATGNPKGSWPMIVTNMSITSPFDDVVMLNIEWQGQGAEVSNPLTATW
jgi:hypothetical protein